MRDRERVLRGLEGAYRAAFREAEEGGDGDRMRQLDLDFQKDQLYLEVLLDVRDLLTPADGDAGAGAKSLLDKARALKDLTRLR